MCQPKEILEYRKRMIGRLSDEELVTWVPADVAERVAGLSAQQLIVALARDSRADSKMRYEWDEVQAEINRRTGRES